MRFPLADYLDARAGCRFDLGSSGMRGTVRPPRPTAAEVRRASEAELRRRLADLSGVEAARLFLTHGATEANFLAVAYLARRRGVRPRARVALPEYPPLVDLVRAAGYRATAAAGPVDLAVISQPHNPVGDLWSPARLAAWAAGARATVVDETFREFTDARSVQHLGLPRLWSTGSFTKLYGADELRVGFVIPPAEDRRGFAEFHGLVADEIAPYSVAGALATLDARERIRRTVRSVVARNQDLWRRAVPGGPPLAAPFAFDDPVPGGGARFAARLLRVSVLVAPGGFFGRPSGVRVGLTRRSFPDGLARYLRVREGRDRSAVTAGAGSSTDRRRRAGAARAAAGRR